MKHKYLLLMLLALPFLLCSCNDSDDVQSIFTGRTWKLTYITKKNDHKWYHFPGVENKVYESYDPMNGTRYFEIDFTGSKEDNVISGDLKGYGSVEVLGRWNANGVSNVFSTSLSKKEVKDPKENTLGKYIIEGLSNAISYSGDENNLYLYFEYDKEMLTMVFAPKIR